MTQFYIYNNTDLGNQVVRLGKMGPLDVEAQQEQVGSGGLDFDDPAGTLNIVGLKPFYIKETAGPAAFTLTGTVAKSSASTTLTGTSTLFTTELQIGRMIAIPGGGGTDYRRVSSITNDTHLTLDYAPANTASGQTATVGSLQRLFTGYVGLRSIARGQGDSLRTGAARRWSVTLDDINSFLSFRVFTESDANRPAETDLQRIAWLLANSRMAGTVFDTGDIPATGAIAMDAADYRGQRTSDLLNDCNQVSGKNAYVYYEESQAKIGLVYDFHSSTRLSSPIRLSNVLTEVDSNEATVGPTMTFPIEPDWTEHDDPSRVVAGVYVAYGTAAAAAYRTLSSTATAFGWRDAVAPTSHVKTLAKANALGDRYLADNATEDVLLTGSVKLPRSVTTQLTAGLRCKVYISHLPSVNDPGYTWCRVLRQSIEQNEESDQFYTLNMDLTPISAAAPTGSSILMAAVVTQGNAAAGGPTDLSAHPWTLDYYSGDFSDPTQFPGPGTDCTLSLYHRAIVPGESGIAAGVWQAHAAQVVGAWVDELSGITPATLSLVTHGNDTVNPAAGGAAEVSGTSTGVLWVQQALQKVDYGQITQLTPVNGLMIRQANMNNQDLTVGTCGVTTDPYPPDIFTSYRVVVGATTVGGSISCTGASPDYNLLGRARGAYSIDAPGTFAVAQSAWGAGLVSGGTATVTLPSPP